MCRLITAVNCILMEDESESVLSYKSKRKKEKPCLGALIGTYYVIFCQEELVPPRHREANPKAVINIGGVKHEVLGQTHIGK